MFSVQIKDHVEHSCGRDFLLQLVVRDNCRRVWLQEFSFTNGNFFATLDSVQFWGQ